ncbi:hypothetical protein [Flavobacterium hiemivividum]|nr:hypothetical protein [Flavobacterium hiemivividum]
MSKQILRSATSIGANIGCVY